MQQLIEDDDFQYEANYILRIKESACNLNGKKNSYKKQISKM